MVSTVRVRVRHPLRGRWDCFVHLVPPDRAVGFEVWPAVVEPASDRTARRWSADQGAVTARLLREFPLGEIQRAAVRALRVRLDSSARHHTIRRYDGLIEALASERRGRKSANLVYAQVAASYVDALGSRSPIADVAEQLHRSTSRVRDLVSEARRRGLLSESPGRGRPGGELTALGRQVLSGGD